MDVAFFADGRGVAQAGGDLFDGPNKVPLGAGPGEIRLETAQGQGGQDRPTPRAEVFCGEVLSANAGR